MRVSVDRASNPGMVKAPPGESAGLLALDGTGDTARERWSVHDGQFFARHMLHEKRARVPNERRLQLGGFHSFQPNGEDIEGVHSGSPSVIAVRADLSRTRLTRRHPLPTSTGPLLICIPLCIAGAKGLL